MTLRFDPGALGDRHAVLAIKSNDPDENPYEFAIAGYGLNAGPVLNITPSDAITNVTGALFCER